MVVACIQLLMIHYLEVKEEGNHMIPELHQEQGMILLDLAMVLQTYEVDLDSQVAVEVEALVATHLGDLGVATSSESTSRLREHES